jgi:molecular chaperone GrpE
VSNEEQVNPENPETELEQPEAVESPKEQVEEAPEQALSAAELQAQVVALQDELVNTRDQALRTAAEAQNIRRRAEQDVEKARKFALEKFSGSLLEIVDNLERAMAAADRDNEAVKPLMEGIDLTYKSFIDTLAKFQVEQVDPAGEPFDPNFHQAMTMVPNPELEPNTVMDVMAKGYTLNGRLLRPAMVVVSKAAE